MKKILFTVILAMLVMAGCSEIKDNSQNGDFGTISFSLTNGSVREIPVQTRQAAAVDFSDFTITMLHYGIYGESGEIGPMKLPANGRIDNIPSGPYDIIVMSHNDMPAASFNNPYYIGLHPTVVYPGKTQQVDITCYQFNGGVYFVYDESLSDEGLENVTAVIKSDSGTLRYEGQNRESIGYFAPGDLIVTLFDGTEPVLIGGGGSRTFDVMANELWKITLALEPETRTAGKSNITLNLEKL